MSRTFEGRDRFAPAAAWLSRGIQLSAFGRAITDYVLLDLPQPHLDGTVLHGVVTRIDRFGNVVTNLDRRIVRTALRRVDGHLRLTVGGHAISRIVSTYAEIPPGEIGAVFGSTGSSRVRRAVGECGRAPGGPRRRACGTPTRRSVELMPGRVVALDPAAVTAASLAPAIEWLRAGGIVAFPTDTLYGLAVDPESARAVDALFDLKARQSGLAPPFIAGSLAAVTRVCGSLSEQALRLASAFWPGPLSLVLDAPAAIVPGARAADGTVAIRVPDHPIARLLADTFGRPVTATSANLSGQPPADSLAALAGLLDDPRVLAIDGGPAPGGAPSTIVDARRRLLCLIRRGAIDWDRVLRSIQA